MGAYRYGVLGAGRQGTAAAYDLAVRGDAERVALADVDPGRARAAADRVNGLAGADLVVAAGLDATDAGALAAFLEPLDAAVSAISYRLNQAISEAAVLARTSLCDLGGHTGIVRRQLELDGRARAAGTCLVPDCGEAPGLSNNLQAYALTLLDEPEEMTLYDGGLPLEPEPPWRYALTFNVDGLTTEYDGTVTYVVDGRLVEVDCLDPAEDETVEMGPPFGTLEAFAAATGSTTPWTLGQACGRSRARSCGIRGTPSGSGPFATWGCSGRSRFPSPMPRWSPARSSTPCWSRGSRSRPARRTWCWPGPWSGAGTGVRRPRPEWTFG